MGDLTCKELVEFLDDYLAGELEPSAASSFAEHLAVCPPCDDYVNTYRTAIELGRKACCGGDSGVAKPPESLIRAILHARDQKDAPDPGTRSV